MAPPLRTPDANTFQKTQRQLMIATPTMEEMETAGKLVRKNNKEVRALLMDGSATIKDANTMVQVMTVQAAEALAQARTAGAQDMYRAMTSEPL